MKLTLTKLLTKIPPLPWNGVAGIEHEQFKFYRAYGLHAANNFPLLTAQFKHHLSVLGHDVGKCGCESCCLIRSVNTIEL